jgi:hypothetical protein
MIREFRAVVEEHNTSSAMDEDDSFCFDNSDSYRRLVSLSWTEEAPAITNYSIVRDADTSDQGKIYHGYCGFTCFASVFYIIPAYQFLGYHVKV